MHARIPATSATTLEALWPALHTVTPSLIRVEADEATYNLHIVARFDVERALFAGQLDVPDLRGAWDETYERLLGVRPTGVADGWLQDIHWSMGAFGYFPTYALGNLIAAQLFDAAQAELGPLDDAFTRGEFAPLLGWLRANVHHHASMLSADELVRRATGSTLSPDAFLTHLRTNVTAAYHL
jgi:carboxypeptidase Taq